MAWVWLVLALVPRAEIQLVVVFVVVALLHLLEKAWSLPRLALTAVLFATLGLVKFTLLALGVGLVLAFVVAAPRERRKPVHRSGPGRRSGASKGWTRRIFSLEFDARLEPIPYVCQLSLWFAEPASNPGGGLDVFVNQVLVAHIEDVYTKIAAHFERRLYVSFTTFGGRTTVTFVLARPSHAPSKADHRELGTVVRRFSVTAEYA